MAAIRAILFDADGVIQHASADLEARLQRVLGFAPESIDDFVREVFQAEELALIGEQDFADALAPVVAKWGGEGTSARLAECWSSIEVDTGVLALIAELRRAGYLCALATNQQRYRATHMASVLGYDAVFDRSFYSCELGVRKPDARYFDVIVKTLGLEPTRMLFIDDREENVAAAERAGLKAAHFVHDRGPQAVPNLMTLLCRFSVDLSR